MRFDQNEYVWDSIWNAPAVVVGVKPDEKAPYVVAELDQRNKSLARLAARKESQLSRYVNVKLPEAEALALADHIEQPFDLEAAKARINAQLVRRGILEAKHAPTQA